jgi:hypothetical protein
MPPLVTCTLMGGLGNQMFQIAAAYAYARREGGTLRIHRQSRCGERPVYWDTFFAALAPFLTPTPFTLPCWMEPGPTQYGTPPPLTEPGVCMIGYLQSSKYFADYAEEIRGLFRPPPAHLEAVKEKYAVLLRESHRVVVMHARRTDYVKHAATHGPLDAGYYREAVRRVAAMVDRPLYLLVSDDPNFWLEIRSEMASVFEGDYMVLRGAMDIETMLLMQQFPYMVMSNSTFAWWAAWLGCARHVWVPARWFGPKGPREWEDIYEAEWERIGPRTPLPNGL